METKLHGLSNKVSLAFLLSFVTDTRVFDAITHCVAGFDQQSSFVLSPVSIDLGDCLHADEPDKLINLLSYPGQHSLAIAKQFSGLSRTGVNS